MYKNIVQEYKNIHINVEKKHTVIIDVKKFEEETIALIPLYKELSLFQETQSIDRYIKELNEI